MAGHGGLVQVSSTHVDYAQGYSPRLGRKTKGGQEATQVRQHAVDPPSRRFPRRPVTDPRRCRRSRQHRPRQCRAGFGPARSSYLVEL